MSGKIAEKSVQDPMPAEHADKSGEDRVYNEQTVCYCQMSDEHYCYTIYLDRVVEMRGYHDKKIPGESHEEAEAGVDCYQAVRQRPALQIRHTFQFM